MSNTPKPGTQFENDLRLIREARGLSIEEMYLLTKIQPDLIAEFEKTGMRENPIYANMTNRWALVKNYSQALGVSRQDAFMGFQESLEGHYKGVLAVNYLGVDPASLIKLQAEAATVKMDPQEMVNTVETVSPFQPPSAETRPDQEAWSVASVPEPATLSAEDRPTELDQDAWNASEATVVSSPPAPDLDATVVSSPPAPDPDATVEMPSVDPEQYAPPTPAPDPVQDIDETEATKVVQPPPSFRIPRQYYDPSARPEPQEPLHPLEDRGPVRYESSPQNSPPVQPPRASEPESRDAERTRNRWWLGAVGLVAVALVTLLVIRFNPFGLTDWTAGEEERITGIGIADLPGEFTGFVRWDEDTREFITLTTNALPQDGEFLFTVWTMEGGRMFARESTGILNARNGQVQLSEQYGWGRIYRRSDGTVVLRSLEPNTYPTWELTGS